MHAVFKCAVAMSGLALAAASFAQVTLYEHDGFEGRSFTTERSVVNLRRQGGFNDRASSAVVLRPGQYPSLAALGLNDRILSVRAVQRQAAVADDRYAPPPIVETDYRRRGNERLFQAQVTSVRAVVATLGGVVAGGIVGSRAGRDRDRPPAYGQDVERCSTATSPAQPEFWDVGYRFRGAQHHVQMTSPPGATVTVNRAGEPRAPERGNEAVEA